MDTAFLCRRNTLTFHFGVRLKVEFANELETSGPVRAARLQRRLNSGWDRQDNAAGLVAAFYFCRRWRAAKPRAIKPVPTIESVMGSGTSMGSASRKNCSRPALATGMIMWN